MKLKRPELWSLLVLVVGITIGTVGTTLAIIFGVQKSESCTCNNVNAELFSVQTGIQKSYMQWNDSFNNPYSLQYQAAVQNLSTTLTLALTSPRDKSFQKMSIASVSLGTRASVQVAQLRKGRDNTVVCFAYGVVYGNEDVDALPSYSTIQSELDSTSNVVAEAKVDNVSSDNNNPCNVINPSTATTLLATSASSLKTDSTPHHRASSFVTQKSLTSQEITTTLSSTRFATSFKPTSSSSSTQGAPTDVAKSSTPHPTSPSIQVSTQTTRIISESPTFSTASMSTKEYSVPFSSTNSNAATTQRLTSTVKPSKITTQMLTRSVSALMSSTTTKIPSSHSQASTISAESATSETSGIPSVSTNQAKTSQIASTVVTMFTQSTLPTTTSSAFSKSLSTVLYLSTSATTILTTGKETQHTTISATTPHTSFSPKISTMPETTRISTLNPRTTTTKTTLYSTPDTYTITSPPSSPAINTDITVASTATSSSTIATVSSMETTKGTSPVVVTSQSSPDITYSTTQSSTSIRPETFTTSRIFSSITQTSSEAATSPSTTVPSTPISSTAWMTTTPCRGEYKFNGDIAMAFELTTNTDKQDVETLVKTLLTYTKNPYSFVPDVVTGVAPSGYILAPYPDTTHYNPPSNYDALSHRAVKFINERNS
ncbi:hypothetical protein RB195_018350 [Necator americanus]|uniref:SEA domain protein n=1 Tax=Necator americanus TaxID=51031 RepID=A0ABR1CAV1_NECAM